MCPAAAHRASCRLHFAEAICGPPELALQIMNNPASVVLRQIFEGQSACALNLAGENGRNYSPRSCVELLATSAARTRCRFCSTDCAASNIAATIPQGSLWLMQDSSTHANAPDASPRLHNW